MRLTGVANLPVRDDSSNGNVMNTRTIRYRLQHDIAKDIALGILEIHPGLSEVDLIDAVMLEMMKGKSALETPFVLNAVKRGIGLIDRDAVAAESRQRNLKLL